AVIGATSAAPIGACDPPAKASWPLLTRLVNATTPSNMRWQQEGSMKDPGDRQFPCYLTHGLMQSLGNEIIYMCSMDSTPSEPSTPRLPSWDDGGAVASRIRGTLTVWLYDIDCTTDLIKSISLVARHLLTQLSSGGSSMRTYKHLTLQAMLAKTNRHEEPIYLFIEPDSYVGVVPPHHHHHIARERCYRMI
ncbi:hypothetical protein M426DRAFT_265640, partial [Hypoxylon sp. CI-4A]